MTTENQYIDKSKLSSTNVDSPAQMRGWFKLIETIRKTDPPSNEPLQSPSSSGITTSTSTNSHLSQSPGTIHSDSLPPESPNLISSPPFIAAASTPVRSTDDTPPIHAQSTPKATGSTRASNRHKKITIRKSSRSKEFAASNNPPDDDIIYQRKRQSVDCTSVIPLATDLQSLPGHNNQDELRDRRFLDYSDINTLSIHLNKCLFIDKKSFSSSSLTKQHIFKTRHNILTKIFKLYYLKTLRKSLADQKEETIKSDLVSSTSTSFRTDWSVNRRSSSSHHYEPRNLFHILQLNPQKQIFLTKQNHLVEKSSDEEEHNINYEHIKSLLVRTYYPHFHTAIQRGHYFGSRSKFLRKHQDLPVIINPQSPTDIDETMTIKLNSPLAIPRQESKKRGRKSKHRKSKEKPLPITSVERRVSEEIPPVVILSSPPLKEKEVNNNIHDRKRKISMTNHTNINEEKKKKKKKKIISLLSPEIVSNEYQDLPYSDSDDDVLPNELPKQNFIKNGLRSNYYKTTNDVDPKSISNKNRLLRRRQPSASLPPFYTGLFQSDEEILSYTDYQLPFDIYWFSQKHGKAIASPSKPTNQYKKNKSSESKQKQLAPNKRIVRNTYTDLPVQSNLLSPNKKHIDKAAMKMEELTEHEKQILSQSGIFLKRNLRRIKEQKELKDKNNNQQKQQTDEHPSLLVFAQNYYHPNFTHAPNSSEENVTLSHKDLLNLFSNHLRRSHFGKTGQYSIELIDTTCYYAQLAQLTLILSEMFDFLLNYRCQNTDIYPSNALKKCPLKRLFPMYYEIISKPIDLTIIRTKLDNGEYLSYDLFEQDLLLLFSNAITYCGEDSDVGRAVRELQIYFINILKTAYQSTIHLFDGLKEDDQNERNLKNLKNFITRLHEKEVINGQIRESLYEMIFTIDNTSPIVYKTIAANTSNTHRTTKISLAYDCIIHCRCGSIYDETLLVQCYACQLWQHHSCVTITDISQPYFCFECHPICEVNPSDCLKTNVHISEINQSSYTTLTRSDGFIIRINECYFVMKQEENLTPSSSLQYDLFFIERLWIDENNIERASGFYYLRPYETFHEVNRKFFSNEVFRFPSTNDSIEITSIIRPCYVLDAGTFCKGKPICEYGSRILSTDLFICEYRVDKLARTFTRLPKSKHIGINTKSYCFDNYIEKLSIKRDYQPHQKEYYQQQQTSRRRSITHPHKLTTKQFEEKSSHIDGIIEKIYCRFHHPNLIPTDTKFSPNQFFQQTTMHENNNRGSKRLRNKNLSSSSSSHIVNKKRRTRSVSSNDNPPESISDNNQSIISALLDALIESISSQNL